MMISIITLKAWVSAGIKSIFHPHSPNFFISYIKQMISLKCAGLMSTLKRHPSSQEKQHTKAWMCYISLREFQPKFVFREVTRLSDSDSSLPLRRLFIHVTPIQDQSIYQHK